MPEISGDFPLPTGLIPSGGPALGAYQLGVAHGRREAWRQSCAPPGSNTPVSRRRGFKAFSAGSRADWGNATRLPGRTCSGWPCREEAGPEKMHDFSPRALAERREAGTVDALAALARLPLEWDFRYAMRPVITDLGRQDRSRK